MHLRIFDVYNNLMFTSCKDHSTDKDSTSNAKDFRCTRGVLEKSGGRARYRDTNRERDFYDLCYDMRFTQNYTIRTVKAMPK